MHDRVTKLNAVHGNFKKSIVLIFAVALVIMAVDRRRSVAAQESPQAQRSSPSAADPIRQRPIRQDDCAFLQKPETAREALARHREELVRKMEKFSSEAAYAS